MSVRFKFHCKKCLLFGVRVLRYIALSFLFEVHLTKKTFLPFRPLNLSTLLQENFVFFEPHFLTVR